MTTWILDIYNDLDKSVFVRRDKYKTMAEIARMLNRNLSSCYNFFYNRDIRKSRGIFRFIDIHRE